MVEVAAGVPSRTRVLTLLPGVVAQDSTFCAFVVLPAHLPFSPLLFSSTLELKIEALKNCLNMVRKCS